MGDDAFDEAYRNGLDEAGVSAGMPEEVSGRRADRFPAKGHPEGEHPGGRHGRDETRHPSQKARIPKARNRTGSSTMEWLIPMESCSSSSSSFEMCP
jgi:hypothetical protein